MTKSTALTTIQKYLLVAAGICLAASIFLPIWRIELDAPQYPEGLKLLIYPNKLGGQVDIVNGLNHYIGMKTIHKEDFIEFTVLPYIIAFFSLMAFLVAYIGKRKWLGVLLIGFILFGILAMVDFWQWEYDYGHNLDPNAAIIVPGMAYQPPLIGFKQLLNFGAYSIPDIGGWLFILAGLLFASTWFLAGRKKNVVVLIAAIFSGVLFTSCTRSGPDPIMYNKEACAHCQMTISDARFGCELITKKGKIFKFDDMICMLGYAKEIGHKNVESYYCTNYLSPNELSNIREMVFIKSETIKSPMNGQMAGYIDGAAAEEQLKMTGGNIITYADLIK